MTYKMKLILYGSAASRERARGILENLSAVRQMIPEAQNTEITLLLSRIQDESSLIPLLSSCGLCGVKLLTY